MLLLIIWPSPVDGGDELLPAHPKCLHGVLRVSVLEDEALLYLLVDPLQLLKMRLELVNSLLVLSEAGQLLLQGALHAHTDGSHGVHLPLYPGTDLGSATNKDEILSLNHDFKCF